MKKQTKPIEFTAKRWYSVNYAGWWEIQEGPSYGDRDLLDEEKSHEAPMAAALMAAAPQMHEALVEINAAIAITSTVAATQALQKVKAALDLYEEIKSTNLGGIFAPAPNDCKL